MISGRVPMMVITLSRFMSDRRRIGVGARPIEHFVRPQHYDHVVLPDVRNVVRPPRNGLDDFRMVTTRVDRVALLRDDMPEVEAGAAADYQEFLGLAVMIMTATRDARKSGEERELPGIGGLEHLDEPPARIAVDRHRIGELLERQITQECRIERALEPRSNPCGYQGRA